MNWKKLFNNLLPISLIILAVLVFFWPVFLKGLVPIPADFVVGVYYPWLDYKWGFAVGVPVKNPITTDVVSFMYPMQMLAIDLFKSGQLPLWNPYILAGTPLLANFQSAPYAITNFVYFLFDKTTGWSIQIILQHILAILFTFLLLRHWKISKLGSVLGGIIYAFAGFNTIWSQWNGHTLTAAFIPLVILFSDKWLIEGKLRYGFLNSLSLALLFFAGYPQIALYLLVSLGVLWLFRFQLKWSYFIKTIMLGVFLLLGMGIAAFQVLPGAELLKYSQRAVEPHPYEWAFLPWSKTITFIAPDFFGNHSTNNYWGPQDYTSNTGFIGVVASCLIFFGLFYFRKNKEVKYLFSLLVVSLLFAYPTFLSIFLWKSGIFGLNAASAHRSLVIFTLAAAGLAAFGFDYIRKLKKFSLIPFLPTFLIFAVFAIYAYVLKINPNLFSGIKDVSYSLVAFRNLIFPVATFAALCGLVLLLKIFGNRKIIYIFIILLAIIELSRFGWKFTPYSDKKWVFPDTPVLTFLKNQEKPNRVTGVVPINMRMPYKIESLEGYDAVYPLRIARLIAAINSGESGTTPVGRYGTVDDPTSPILDLVNTKFHLAIKKDIRGNPDPKGTIAEYYLTPHYKKVFEDKTVVVLESTKALPRAFVVYKWEETTGDTDTLNKLLDKNYPYGQKIIIENYSKKPTNALGKGETKYEKYLEDSSEIKVKSSEDGLLFVSDTDFPGWKAYVDDQETKIYRADFAFRAIEIPKGEHLVKFVYKPSSYNQGIIISIISLLGLTTICVLGKVLGRRAN